jgi:2-(3-amino-3-carboxypropyl)histidine synthase
MHILGDVTYGACCIDDFTASALNVDLLVHYGHSCLIPIDTCKVNILYVFVDIKFDMEHFIEILKLNFTKNTKLALVSTIQFISSLHMAKKLLSSYFEDIIIPQEKPLSSGEILGCTSPKILSPRDAIMYIYFFNKYK